MSLTAANFHLNHLHTTTRTPLPCCTLSLSSRCLVLSAPRPFPSLRSTYSKPVFLISLALFSCFSFPSTRMSIDSCRHCLLSFLRVYRFSDCSRSSTLLRQPFSTTMSRQQAGYPRVAAYVYPTAKRGNHCDTYKSIAKGDVEIRDPYR